MRDIISVRRDFVIAQNIRELRNHLSLSQTAFGERLNVSRNVINNLELGRVEPNDMMIAHILSLIHIFSSCLFPRQ